ncbi:metal-dependent transcriptional regulator [Chloroflexus sp.]|uniref:metal-dependent transcriptional regulator n=1 Tax=Chloroflexus sp. TaxID=1904827 RepID=UPI0026278B82|nr:metal-dependent transcriptional regulator [uncultured Chloroflexus sp.]
MSESVEMYLVMTALLRAAPDQPVPVSRLASRLGVSQVSANEMCHRLQERGLLSYQPYRGVTLTPDGEEWAQRILSRRRMWVIFLVQNLGIEPAEADALACQLEHVTSDRLDAALKAFLERDPAAAALTDGEPKPLSACAAGMHGRVVTVDVEAAVAAFLSRQGLAPGAMVEVLAVSDDRSALVQTGDHQLALSGTLATRIILVADTELTERRAVWRRCSAFWSCLRGDVPECSAIESHPGEQ